MKEEKKKKKTPLYLNFKRFSFYFIFFISSLLYHPCDLYQKDLKRKTTSKQEHRKIGKGNKEKKYIYIKKGEITIFLNMPPNNKLSNVRKN